MDSKVRDTTSSGNQVLNLDKYMNIDEFMQVLREAELITPFGKLQTDADVYRGNFRNFPRFSLESENQNSCLTKKSVIPLTPVVIQVIEIERNLRDADMLMETSGVMNYGPQHTKKILQDSELTNYLLLLSDKEVTVWFNGT